MLVYVCSSLRPRTVKRVDKIIAQLEAKFMPPLKFFRPNGTDPAKMMETVKADVDAIERCDEVWVIGRFGRDCSWEIGYAMALGKRVIVWRDHTNQRKFDSDWMLRIGYGRGLLQVRELKEHV